MRSLALAATLTFGYLVFTKLASQLNADKLAELAIIPVIFIIQTLVSWLVSTAIAKLFRFNRRAANFVTAMGVFGNSNSLPISLVLSLSQTIKGLHWDRIPGDNDDEVGARGILYLLIFQQLGQLVRWSWGYHVLLAPRDRYEEYAEQIAEEGTYRDQPDLLIEGLDGETEDEGVSDDARSIDSRLYSPAGPTPPGCTSRASVTGSSDDGNSLSKKKGKAYSSTSLNSSSSQQAATGIQNRPEAETLGAFGRFKKSACSTLCSTSSKVYASLPAPLQFVVRSVQFIAGKIASFIWEFMNPPLWAMLIAVLVASIPSLQRLFFEEGSFIKNSVTSAVASSGGVAVPLILVVLGANLARNTMASTDDKADPEEEEIGTKLLVAALLSRMVLPTAIMAPILALLAKYLNISILDDPIFVIVCFLLTGAPSALQLAQICQINNVFEKTMGRILFQSYVIWILPSTLVLVMMALEVIEWAK